MLSKLVRVLSLLVVASLSACGSGGPPQVIGDKATLPAGCTLQKLATRLQIAMPEFIKFDGKYPEDWPPSVTLPANTYLMGGGQVVPSEKSNALAKIGKYNVYEMKGLVNLPPDQVISHFESILSALDLKSNGSEQHNNTYDVDAYRVHLLPYVEDQTSRYYDVDFTVFRYDDLGGWTYFHFVISIRS